MSGVVVVVMAVTGALMVVMGCVRGTVVLSMVVDIMLD